MTDNPAPTPRHICRTPAESFAAGLADAKNHRPLSPAERTRLAALVRPYLTLPEPQEPARQEEDGT